MIKFNMEFQVDNEGAAITASAVSDSGQIAVFSDSFGYMHVWGYSEESLESVFEFHVALPSPPTVPDDEIEIDEQTVRYLVALLFNFFK